MANTKTAITINTNKIKPNNIFVIYSPFDYNCIIYFYTPMSIIIVSSQITLLRYRLCTHTYV